jgi:hypothetical protein
MRTDAPDFAGLDLLRGIWQACSGQARQARALPPSPPPLNARVAM